MNIQLEGGFYIGVPQVFTEDFCIDATPHAVRGIGVAKGVKLVMPDPGSSLKARITVAAYARLHTFIGSCDNIFRCGSGMFFEKRHNSGWKRNGANRAFGLWLLDYHAGPGSGTWY